MLFNKKYCFKNLFFFFSTPHEKIVIRTESWVKNRDTNRIVGLVYRYSPTNEYSFFIKYLFFCNNTDCYKGHRLKQIIGYQYQSNVLGVHTIIYIFSFHKMF